MHRSLATLREYLTMFTPNRRGRDYTANLCQRLLSTATTNRQGVYATDLRPRYLILVRNEQLHDRHHCDGFATRKPREADLVAASVSVPLTANTVSANTIGCANQRQGEISQTHGIVDITTKMTQPISNADALCHSSQ